MDNPRTLLLELAGHAIDAVHGEHLVKQAAQRYAPRGPVQLVATGKAAAAMLDGAVQSLTAGIERALLISAKDYAGTVAQKIPHETLFGGHPVPTEHSLVAGRRLIEWISETPADAQLLFLVSGGTSSMLEVPAEGVGLSDLRRTNQWLLSSGLAIDAVNAIRCRLSAIKCGRLLEYLGRRSVEVWLLSDVASDDPATIGSGLCYPALRNAPVVGELPRWLRVLLDTVDQAASQKKVDRIRTPTHRVLGNLAMACEAAAVNARRAGYAVHLYSGEIDGDARDIGRKLAVFLETAVPGVHIWGGETTVCLPDEPGQGGRNQHLALAAAMQLAGREGIYLLALATDGRDGPGEDAGALVDGGTIGRGELNGLDAEEELHCANAGGFLEASGDLISTGPTGTNVRDLVIAWKE